MNKRTTPQRVVERANIVLLLCRGTVGGDCREVGVSRPTRSGSTGTRQVALKSCSRTDHARVDPARSLRNEAEIVRRGEARRRHALELPSHGQGSGRPSDHHLADLGLMDYSPTASSTSSCPLILTSLKSCATWWVSTFGAGRCLRFRREEPDPSPRPHPARSSPQEGARWNHDP